MQKSKSLIISLLVFLLCAIPVAPVLADENQPNPQQETDQSSTANESPQAEPEVELAPDDEPPIEPPIEPVEEEVVETPSATAGLNSKIPATNAKATVDEKTGALVYNYPIDLPAGRAGMTPELSLSYNSRGITQIDSIAGLGWGLSVPYIKREPSKGTNNLYTGAYFSSSESGNLVATASTQFTQHVVYRPETDEGGYLKYSFNNDDSWTVIDKDGRTYTYGQTAASRQDDQNNFGDTYKWMLSKISDTHGNEIQYSYIKDSGQIYPSQIVYAYHPSAPAVNTVSFAYTNPADYGSTVYNSAYPVTTNKLLNSIVVSTTIDGATSTSTYQMNFTDAQFLKQKVLSSIERINNFPNAQYTQEFDDITTFSYSTKTPGWENGSYDLSQTYLDYDGHNTIKNDTDIADFDLNGFPDLLVSTKNSVQEQFNFLLLNNGTNFVDSTTAWNVPNIDLSNNYVTVDLNGDRLPDLEPRSVDENETPPVYINTGSGFVEDTSGTWLMNNYVPEILNCGPNVGDGLSYKTNTFFFDINHDDKNDIVYFGGPNDFKVYLNNDNGWAVKDGYTFTPKPDSDYDFSRDCNYNPPAPTPNLQTLIDFNGDGLEDYYHMDFGAYLNIGSGFVYSEDYSKPSDDGQRTAVADINGDGLVDLVAYDELSSSQRCQINYLNTGTGFLKVSASGHCALAGDWIAGSLSFNNTNNAYVGSFLDVTADGFPDIVATAGGNHVGGELKSMNNGKDGWTGNPLNSQWYQLVTPSYGTFFDLNSDGILDFITTMTTFHGSNQQSPKRVYTGKAAIPNRLTQITTALGAQTSVTYGTVSTNLNDTNTAPMSVVKKVVVSNIDQSQPDMISQYSYSGGSYIVDPATKNKRFAGSQKVTSTESGSDLVPKRITETYFHQANGSDIASNEPIDDAIAFIGKPYYTVVKNSAGTTKKEDWIKYATKKLVIDPQNEAAKSVFVYPTQHVTKTTDSGMAVATAQTFSYELTLGEQQMVTSLGLVNAGPDGTYTDIAGDTRYQVFEYAKNLDSTIVKPSRTDIRSSPSPADTISRTESFYDSQSFGIVGTTGNLTKESSWVAGNGTTVANTIYTYDAFGNVLTLVNPRNFTTTYTYDSATKTQVATETNAANQTTTYTYLAGKPKTVTDPNGRMTTYNYSSLGWLYSITTQNTAGNQVVRQILVQNDGAWALETYAQLVNSTEDLTVQSFDNLGRPLRNIRRLTNHETGTHGAYYLKEAKTYDALGREITTSAPYGSPASSDYDSLLTVSVPANLTTTTSYDVFDRPLAVANAIGTTSFAYSGLEKTIIDPNSSKKKLKSDAYGNLIQVTEYNNDQKYITTYVYDSRNLLTNITDALGNVRNFQYNNAGWLTTSEDLHPVGDGDFGTYQVTYDLNGNTVAEQQPNGTVIDSTYDSLDRPIIIDSVSTAEQDFSFSYDTCLNGKGRLCGVIGTLPNSVAIEKSYNYGISGAPTGVDVKTLDNKYSTSYEYNYSDEVSKTIYPDGTTQRIVFGDWAQPSKVFLTLPAQAETMYATIARHFTEQPSEISIIDGPTSANTYDASKLYRKSEYSAVMNGSTLHSYEYTYDDANNITRIVERNVTKDYTYDDLNRLVHAEHTLRDSSLSYDYTYDAIGNITSLNDEAYAYSGDGKINPHAVTIIGEDRYEYDDNGNVVAMPNKTMTWNWQNQPTQIVVDNTMNINAYYDEGGNRVIYQTPSSTEISVGDGYLVRGSSTEISVNVDGLLLGTVSGGSVYSTVADHLGTPVKQVAVGGVTGGEVVEDVSYDPYGAVLAQEGSLDTKKGYTGHQEDVDTGLVYAKARYYNPSVGRFMSQDAVHLELGNRNQVKNLTGLEQKVLLADPQALNSYSYARNNPLIYIDPQGNFFLAPLFYAATAAVMVYAPVAINYLNSLLTPLGQHAIVTSINDYQSGNKTAAVVGVATAGTGSGTTKVARNVLSKAGEKVIQATRPVKQQILRERNDIINRAISTGDAKTISIFSNLYKPSDELLGGTAGAIQFEAKHNITLSRSIYGHVQKAEDKVREINNHISTLGNSNPNATQMLLTERQNLERSLYSNWK